MNCFALCQLVVTVDQIGQIGELYAQACLVYLTPLRLVLNHIIPLFFDSYTRVSQQVTTNLASEPSAEVPVTVDGQRLCHTKNLNSFYFINY